MAGFSANAIAAILPISMSSFKKYRAIGTQLTMTRFAATEQRPLRDRMRFTGCLTSGALTAMLLAGCGLSTVPQPVPAVPSQTRGLRAAPAWVVDRMTRVAPDLHFNFDSHALSKPEQRKLMQIALGLEDLLHDFSGPDHRGRRPLRRSRLGGIQRTTRIGTRRCGEARSPESRLSG